MGVPKLVPRKVTRPMLCVRLQWGHTTYKICVEPNNIETKPSETIYFFSVTPIIWEDV